MARMNPEDPPTRKGPVHRYMEFEEQEKKRQGPPKPPNRKGPELRNKNGELERALVKKFKNGGCVMGNRGVRDTKMV